MTSIVKPTIKKIGIKKLGIWTLTSLVLGNMIGSGIFLLPSGLASVGSISLYSWIFSGLGALALALVFADLSHHHPKTGGPYAYARLAFGEFVGFQTAYYYWVALWVGNAAIAVAAVGYLRVYFPFLSSPLLSGLTGILLIWIFTFINILGVHRVGVTQLVTTILKVIPLLLVATVGWHYVHPEYFSQYYIIKPGVSSVSAVSLGMALTFWAFVGLESATIPADSVDRPSRTIPLATIIGILLAAFIYIVSSAAIMGMIPAPDLAHSTSPFADAAKIILGNLGGDLIALGAVISCLGAINGWVLLQGQVAMAIAEDGFFPKIFAERNRYDVPGKGLVISSGLITILMLLTISDSLVKQFEVIILLATLGALVPYFYTSIAEVVLMKQDQAQLSGFFIIRIVISVIAAIFSFWAIANSGEDIIYYGCLLLLTSVPLYAWQTYKKQASFSKEEQADSRQI